MKIVKNKDFERDASVKRHDNPDSPLRFPIFFAGYSVESRRGYLMLFYEFIQCRHDSLT